MEVDGTGVLRQSSSLTPTPVPVDTDGRESKGSPNEYPRSPRIL